MTRKDHWEQVYANKPVDRLGWYKPQLQTSLAWIKELALAPTAPIIDVGGGASTLVDDLLKQGYQSITVLDLSEKALSLTRARLGLEAEFVTWLCGDITSIDLPKNRYALWHDRAVFHFLTEPDQQRAYRQKLMQSLLPSGNLIIGTFAPEAPPTCSGLPVRRYSLDQLQETLGDAFELKDHRKELHTTPGGVEQMFLFCRFCKSD